MTDYILSYIFPSHGIIHEAFARSLLGLGAKLPPVQVMAKPSARPYAARNNIITEWLDEFPEVDWLLMVDTDEMFPPSAVKILFDTAEAVKEATGEYPGVVGGLVFRWNEPELRPEPTIYFWNPERGDWSMSMLYPEKQAFRVDATGSGNIIIHRSAAEAVRERYGDHWFEDRVRDNALGEEYTQGNDIGFCELVNEVGSTVYVNTAAEFGHNKPFWLTSKEAGAWREQNLDL